MDLNNSSSVNEIPSVKTTACFLAPLPDDLWPKYSSSLKNKLARVDLIDENNRKSTSMVRVLFKDFAREETLPVECLIAANRYLEQIQPAVESMGLFLDDAEKLEGLNESARAELDIIIKDLFGGSDNRLKAILCQKLSSKKRKVSKITKLKEEINVLVI